MPPMIQTRNVRKSFGSSEVLRGIDLEIEQGESVVILGRSGCGKSVYLKHLVALIEPDDGEVLVDGIQIVGMRERQLLEVRRKFGMLFQNAALFDSMTVAENVGFVLEQERKLTRGEIDKRVAKALDLVELDGTQNKKPAELSGGMRKRVGLARAIIYQPQIVLYDEPTTGLDPVVSDSIDKLIMRVNEQLKVTTIAVTHDMRSARRIGTRIVLFHEGRVYHSGTPDETFNSTDPVVSRFIEGVSDSREDTW